MDIIAPDRPAAKAGPTKIRADVPPDPCVRAFAELVDARRRADWQAARRARADLQRLGWLVGATAPKGRGLGHG